MRLTTHCKRYATVVFLAVLGLILTGQGVLHAAAPSGWTGDVPLEPPAPPPLRTLYVDRSSKGGPCNDSYTADENAQAKGKKPWCTLGIAGQEAIAGDLVLVRSGKTAYSEPTSFGAGLAVLTLVNLGQADHPIMFKAYPGERPVIDPLGKLPGICPDCVTFGVAAGYDSPTTACTNNHCDYHVIIDGFTLTNWSVWNQDPNPNVFHFSQYAMAFAPFHAGNLGHITVRNCELGPGGGGGVLFTQSVYAFTFEYNYVHDNHTHGWTSPLNFYLPIGHLEGRNTVRGNFIANNRDTPPPRGLEKYCSGVGEASMCEDGVPGFNGYCPCVANANCRSGSCVDNPYGGSGFSDQAHSSDGNTEGHGMIIDVGGGICDYSGQPTVACNRADDSACTNVCTGPGTPYACCTGAGLGNCCHMGADSDYLIESNVIYDNYGTCIAVFKSDNVNLRNNTCDNNGRRGRRNDGEIITWGDHMQVENNIVVTRSTGMCSCSTNADCGGAHGWCAPSTATQSLANTCVTGAKSVCSSNSDCLNGNECLSPIALGQAYGGSLFPADPATNTEGSNMLFCPNPSLTKIIRLADDVQITLDQFKASSDAMTYGWSDGDLGSNPLFTSASSFRLRAGSPAINSGDAANHAPRDVTGQEYVNPDRGAFKH